MRFLCVSVFFWMAFLVGFTYLCYRSTYGKFKKDRAAGATSIWNKPIDFAEWIDLKGVAKQVTKVVLMIISFIILIAIICDTINVKHVNHHYEEVVYEQFEVQREVIEEAFEREYVPASIYNKVSDYNKELTVYKNLYEDRGYRWNFSGDFDWNKLEYIKIK